MENVVNGEKSKIKLYCFVLDCPDPAQLAQFYCQLLGWKVAFGDSAFLDIASPDCSVRIGFQRCDGYQPPVWPEEVGKQQQMAHLDFAVESVADMKRWATFALSIGAQEPPVQYGGDDWYTLLDPVGHPFCFCVW